MRLLKWLRGEAGAIWIFMLMAQAGALNAAGFLMFGQTLSHMTGNLTKLGLGLSGRVREPALMFLAVLACFLLGATLSGYAFPRHTQGQWRRCGQVLMAGGLMLLVTDQLGFPAWFRIGLTAFVLGSQNGLALRYRGILSRTTHVTGHLTDLGAALGRMILARSFRGQDLHVMLFHLGCLLAFLLGVALLSLYASLTWLSSAFGPVALCGLAYILLGLITLGALRYRKSLAI